MQKGYKLRAAVPIFILAIVSAVIIATILILPHDTPVVTPSVMYGNVLNGGKVAVDGSMLFYVDADGKLRCQSGGKNYDISEGADCISPYGTGIIYRTEKGEAVYSNFNGESKRTVLTGVEQMMVSGNWIYYTHDGGKLAKCFIKNSKVRELGLEVEQFLVVTNQILYTARDGYLYSALTDGSGSAKFLNEKIDSFTWQNSLVFYKKDGVLNAVSASNTARKTTYFKVDEYNIMESGLLVFTDESGLHTYDLNDSSAKVRDVAVKGDKPSGISVIGDEIYYYTAQGQMFKCLKDGSKTVEF